MLNFLSGQLQALYQKHLEYYQQQQTPPAAVSADRADFNTAALVTHLVQQGSILSQASAEQLSPDTKSAVDKDVAITVESFLRSMANDAGGNDIRHCALAKLEVF